MSTSPKSRGFTLVEMLVVIAIIAILAGLILTVAAGGFGRGKQTINATEISQLVGALERYKSENGNQYPPSFNEVIPGYASYAACYTANPAPNGPWASTVLGRYLRKSYNKISDRDIAYMFVYVADNMDQCTALPFWLNQTSADVRYPFTNPEKRSYFKMGEQRLTQLGTVAGDPPNGYPAMTLYGYRPPHALESYYIYIEARHYPFHVNNDLSSNQAGGRPAAGTGAGRPPEMSVRPFLRIGTTMAININPADLRNYVNGESFQLFCAGIDGRYSVNHDLVRKFPCGESGLDFAGNPLPAGIFADDADNQTNFSDGTSIADVAVQ